MVIAIIKKTGSFLESVIDRLISAAGALLFIQIPSFLVQYQQRLGGHVDELARLINKYKSAAAENGRTVEEYIGLHVNSGIKEFTSTGKLMSENFERFTELSSSLKNLTGSDGIMKFYHFIKGIDTDIFTATLKNFVPGISFSTDTLIYGVIGIVFFMILYVIIKKVLMLITGAVRTR